MELPNLFNAPPADRLFIAILMVDGYVQAALWRAHDPTVQILKTSQPQHFSDEKSAIVAVDQVLQDLGEQSEGVHEVVFGFESSWVGSTGIKDEQKPLLKRLTKELSLKAVGFVVVTEAVLQHLHRQDSRHTSLVVQVSPHALTVNWVHLGDLKGEVTVGKSDQLAADVVEALARLPKSADETKTIWPSHIELVSVGVESDILHKGEQQLQGYDWVGQQGFLHAPTVKMHSPEMALNAVIMEGGRAVAEAQGLIKSIPETGMEEHANVVPPTELGFSPVVVTEPVNHHPELAIDPPETPNHQPIMSHHMPPMHTPHSSPEEPELAVIPDHRSGESKGSWWRRHKPFVTLGVGLGIVTLMIVAVGAIWWSMSAQVSVKLKTKTVNRDVVLTLDPEATQSDPVARVLAAKVVKQSVDGSKAIPTTGVKLVGDKAKGTVVLINKTSSNKNFAAGTKLKSGKLEFTLDKEVTVASASVSQQGSLSETRTYGKTEVMVQAAAIGTESNLAKDTELIVADFANSSYVATVKDGLSGGASREIRVVSEKDRQTVLEKLKAELLTKLAEQLKTQAGSGEYIVPSGKIAFDKQTYDAKVGDEVEALNLDVKATSEGLKYQKSDLLPLATALLSEQIPVGYALSQDQPQLLTDSNNSASSAAQVQLKANISAQARPQVDVKAWIPEIVSLSKSEAEAKLKSHGEVDQVTIKLFPSWLEKVWSALPSRSSRITIQAES